MTNKSLYDDCYIVMSQYGIQRMTKRPGKLGRGEVSVRVRLTIPTKVFEEPMFSAMVTVPESVVLRPGASVEVLMPEEGQSDE